MKIGIFQDIHANLPALKKGIEFFRAHNCTKIYHVGDLIGIGPYPKEVFELAISVEEMVFIMGNHDHWFGFGMPVPTPIYMDKDEVSHHLWTHSQIGEIHSANVRKWEFVKELTFANGKSVTFVHYGYDEKTDWFKAYVKEPTPSLLDHLFDNHDSDMVFYGHNHEASDIMGKARYVNLGSAGCFDKAEVRLGILEIEGEELSLEKYSIAYEDGGFMEEFEKRKVPGKRFYYKSICDEKIERKPILEIKKIHDLTFDTEETILATTLSAPNECVMLMSDGKIIRYNIEKEDNEVLFSVKNRVSYSDSGFDIHAPSTIYTMDSIVVIVNDYKRHGYVHYPGNYESLHLWRKDYHADISRYPICLFKDENDIPHLIYGVAWNHLQIMNLDTRQILTASKSLIEEFAEEKHIKSVQKYGEGNKLAWPSEYDYFFGKIEMAPDKKHFLSAGWCWGSSDYYVLYELEHFLTNNRIAEKPIDGWEHNNRAVCWINAKTIAIAYHPYQEGEEGSSKENPFEIHFYSLKGENVEFERKIEIDGLDMVNSNMHFNKEIDAIIAFSDDFGTAILSLNGEILCHNLQLKPTEYHLEMNLFVKAEEKAIAIYQIHN